MNNLMMRSLLFGARREQARDLGAKVVATGIVAPFDVDSLVLRAPSQKVARRLKRHGYEYGTWKLRAGGKARGWA